MDEEHLPSSSVLPYPPYGAPIPPYPPYGTFSDRERVNATVDTSLPEYSPQLFIPRSTEESFLLPPTYIASTTSSSEGDRVLSQWFGPP
jgi:hypothetical protein